MNQSDELIRASGGTRNGTGSDSGCPPTVKFKQLHFKALDPTGKRKPAKEFLFDRIGLRLGGWACVDQECLGGSLPRQKPELWGWMPLLRPWGACLEQVLTPGPGTWKHVLWGSGKELGVVRLLESAVLKLTFWKGVWFLVIKNCVFICNEQWSS